MHIQLLSHNADYHGCQITRGLIGAGKECRADPILSSMEDNDKAMLITGRTVN